MGKFSLRQQLVLPFVLLVIFVSAGIGWGSFRAGKQAVAELSQRILLDMVDRIGHVTESHLASALTALQAVAPDPGATSKIEPFSNELASLEARFWVASGLFMEVDSYVYFGGVDGRFIGISRNKPTMGELYLREPDSAKRVVYALTATGERDRLLRSDDYDPRSRPWYKTAISENHAIWSPIYNDYASKQPIITLAKAVVGARRQLVGVIATDVPLRTLTEYLRGLSVSRNGVAFIMDGNGQLIATSGNEMPFKQVGDRIERMRADEMHSDLIRDTYNKLREWKAQGANLKIPLARQFQSSDDTIEVAAAQIGDRYGVSWTLVVAIPRADFMGGVTRSLYQGTFIAFACILAALSLGLFMLNRVLRDIKRLTDAAKQIGNGEPLPELNIRRRDEIGLLAQTFSEMEYNLRIDKLTGVFNREAVNAQIGYLQRQAAEQPARQIAFALLFIDLDRFKTINDQYGHAAGDQALAVVAARLKSAVRATDIVARYGGDEFVILLKGIASLDDVTHTCDKIRALAEEPVALEHTLIEVGLSLGWALFPQDGRDAKTLLKVADSRMFQTKKIRKAIRKGSHLQPVEP